MLERLVMDSYLAQTNKADLVDVETLISAFPDIPPILPPLNTANIKVLTAKFTLAEVVCFVDFNIVIF